jgi:hypothetical protein
MSLCEIERFAADLKSNAGLRAEAENAQADKSSATPLHRVAAFAASKGYAFTADELREQVKAKAKAKAKAAGKQLTDAELDGVAGGGINPNAVLPIIDAVNAIEDIILKTGTDVKNAGTTPGVSDF